MRGRDANRLARLGLLGLNPDGMAMALAGLGLALVVTATAEGRDEAPGGRGNHASATVPSIAPQNRQSVVAVTPWGSML